LNACLSHSVRATVGDTFAFCDWHAVPAHVRAELSEFQSRNGFRNAVLSLELVRIVTLCRKRKIPVAAFKGPLLAEQAYGKLALREFVDLDVVVHSEDVPAASRLLLDCGYLPAGSGIDREYVAQSGQLTYLHSISRAGIDLHWRFAPFSLPCPFAEEEIWGELQQVPLAGASVPTFSWDHLALFLAFHGSKERWRKLKWICDFSALYVARPELDWEALRLRAARRHCSRSLLVAACLCDALGLPAPPGLIESGHRDPAVGRLVSRVLGRLDNPREETELSIFLDEIAATERRRDKARHFVTLLTTLTISDFEAVRLPARLRGLYYLIRPFRLAAKVAGFLYRSRAAR
jgi:hypothetical protein